MTQAGVPLIDIRNLRKQVIGPSPLRVRKFQLDHADRIALFGLDATGVEAFVHLLTGALLPDEGDVLIARHTPRAFSTAAEWLRSLDRFGFVPSRAVFLEPLPLISNLAVPLTLAIDLLPDDVRRRITTLAQEVALEQRLEDPLSALNA